MDEPVLRLESLLGDADQRVAATQVRIDRQRLLIATLRERGADQTAALSLLLQLSDMQALHVATRDRLAEALANLAK